MRVSVLLYFNIVTFISFIFKKFARLLILTLIYQPIYTEYTIYLLLVLCFAAQVFHLLYYHRRLMAYPVEPGISDAVQLPVSVIISARNEAINLEANLPVILDQDYQNFEVVVINDCSVDNSEQILKVLQQQYSNLKVVTVKEHPRFKTGKKFALTMGIKAAQHEHLLFTDADCAPASPQWIAGMAGKFTPAETQIVLGYSPYVKTKGFINAFTRFETIKTGMNYLSAALANNAYMGIGRNLAYTKKLFFGGKGFASHMHIISGDDDLFVNQNATPVNTAIMLQPQAFTLSHTQTAWQAYFRQKRRHMGAGKYYRNTHRRMLSTEAISGFLFYTALAAGLILKLSPAVIAATYASRLLLQIAIYQNVFKKLQGKDLIWLLPTFDFIYYVYLNIFGLIGTFIKTIKWK